MSAVYFLGRVCSPLAGSVQHGVRGPLEHTARRSRHGMCWRRPPAPRPPVWSPCGNPCRNSAESQAPARCHPIAVAQGFFGGADRRSSSKVTRRSGELLEIGAAFRRLIEIERGIANVFDVGGNSKAEDEHQQRRTNEGESQSHRIAKDLHGFIAGVCEHPTKAQLKAGLLRRRWRDWQAARPQVRRRTLCPCFRRWARRRQSRPPYSR